MRTTQGIFSSDAVKEAAESYRAILRSAPDDTEARMNLAWCLLVLALLESGEQTGRAEQPGPEDALQTGPAAPTFPPDLNAAVLLKECLHHSLTIRHISPRAADQDDVDKLEALVALAGGKDALGVANAESTRILTNIASVLQHVSEDSAGAGDQIE